MTQFSITIDIDWASEIAIEETLEFFQEQKIKTTIFSTHDSPYISENLNCLEVGLHPYFSPESSHGKTIKETVDYVMRLPHNLKAFRSHRFGICNSSYAAMQKIGMLISSNVCTDCEIIRPFKNRFGMLEVPIFLEDGGYLYNKHRLSISEQLKQKINIDIPKIILIHPMHFVLNSPSFQFMLSIKKSFDRNQWNNMTKKCISSLRNKKHGIRDFLVELLNYSHETISLGQLYHNVQEQNIL